MTSTRTNRLAQPSVSSGSIILKRSQAVTSLTLKRSSSCCIYSGKRLCFARCLTSGSLLISFSGRKPSQVACCTVQRCASDRWSKGISEASQAICIGKPLPHIHRKCLFAFCFLNSLVLVVFQRVDVGSMHACPCLH